VRKLVWCGEKQSVGPAGARTPFHNVPVRGLVLLGNSWPTGNGNKEVIPVLNQISCAVCSEINVVTFCVWDSFSRHKSWYDCPTITVFLRTWNSRKLRKQVKQL
jgi:hypothetical protein